MRKKYKNGKSSGGKKFLLAIGVIVLLVMLFFLSFWVTSMILKMNQNPVIPQGSDAVVSSTPKPTYEELETRVAEQQEEIEKLEEELAQYRLGGSPTPTATMAPAASAKPKASATPAPTAKPSAKPSVKPTVVPTTAPTVAPTTAPTVAPTVAPTKTPVQILPPGLQ